MSAGFVGEVLWRMRVSGDELADLLSLILVVESGYVIFDVQCKCRALVEIVRRRWIK